MAKINLGSLQKSVNAACAMMDRLREEKAELLNALIAVTGELGEYIQSEYATSKNDHPELERESYVNAMDLIRKFQKRKD